jgi:methylmalonyl-CoA mutase
VTAASLFDGHDASINIMRRLIQAGGAEVIHLGHNRSVGEVVTSALQEDVQAIALSSYQGGHLEYLHYMKELLREAGADHIKVFAGGGGTIVPREIEELHASGIDRVFSPEDGRNLGLVGMINHMLKAADFETLEVALPSPEAVCEPATRQAQMLAIARYVTLAERTGLLPVETVEELWKPILERAAASRTRVLGFTGPGGAGKSSYLDELVRRLLHERPDRRLAIVSVDPTKRATGGALLGDRIRMNAVYSPNVYMRSLATRGAGAELSAAVRDVLAVLKAAEFDLILLETSGIGQGSSEVVDVSDHSVYVMTPEYGAASQLEKIDMIDLADMIVLNKYDRRGAPDALRDVRRQFRRSHDLFGDEVADEDLPIFGTVSSRFHDKGVTGSCLRILRDLEARTGTALDIAFEDPCVAASPDADPLIPAARQGYLAAIAAAVRDHRSSVEAEVARVRELDALELAAARLAEAGGEVPASLAAAVADARGALSPRAQEVLEDWEQKHEDYSNEELVFHVRGKELRQPLCRESLSGLKIPRVALPREGDRGALLRFLLLENLPGFFPFTAGVFPLKRVDEDPKRMFAGEGPPARTNARFHYLCKGQSARRLSTAFDSVTLYGQDPDARPDIYGKVGESGVSICTLDDMKRLYAGFDLCDPNTSVSMTINGPAPVMLAFFMNTAIDQQVDRFEEKHGRIPDPAEHEEIVERVLEIVRGTVQADILKEDQAQNTCIFSTGFALKMMGDIQEYFIERNVRNYYSVSISGYHIAEAGANPISQLAFTLANGFTYVEYYLGRGMKIDDFAPNLSYFFSNGLDPEYAVLGRVARRIWSIAMRDLYGANERSQKLKYHIQTSGRSLHAMEITFNDFRTTLQAVMALQDNCNSLHTNSYDEAVTTPTSESVRRAMAIQMIITKEFGLSKNENPLQGSHIIDELTDLVEEAVLQEFDRISDRGGVLGAMETQYQRGRIQEESLLYERLKHSGELPIVGVNTFVDPEQDTQALLDAMELSRSTEEEKEQRLADVQAFWKRHEDEAPAALTRLQEVALSGGNIFAELMRTVRVASLGQITHALFEVGGEYRRNL